MEIKVCDERRPGMTLTERLNNPQRRMPRDTDLVILDTLPTEADMREAARAMNGETVLRRALVNGIRRLSDTLKEANEICRSAHEIAKRDGADPARALGFFDSREPMGSGTTAVRLRWV